MWGVALAELADRGVSLVGGPDATVVLYDDIETDTLVPVPHTGTASTHRH